MSETVVTQVFLTRRNLLTLLSKLDRKEAGDVTECTLIKKDTSHPKYPQSHPLMFVTAVEDSEYYTTREGGPVDVRDDPNFKEMP